MEWYHWAILAGLAILGAAIYMGWQTRKARTVGRDEGRKEILKRNIEDRDVEVKKSEADAEPTKELTGSKLTQKLNGLWRKK